LCRGGLQRRNEAAFDEIEHPSRFEGIVPLLTRRTDRRKALGCESRGTRATVFRALRRVALCLHPDETAQARLDALESR
jgi:hypothetical protein